MTDNTQPAVTTQPALAPAVQPQPAIQAAPEVNYTVPVQIPSDLMNQLVSLSNDSGSSVSHVCLQLIQKALNVQMLSEGTISDISEQAQEIFKTASLEAVLEGLRIYNVPKTQPTGTDAAPTVSLREGDIIFNTTSDVKDLIAQINAFRITKGLAPFEKSICELLYHYGLSLGDYMMCEKATGITLNKYKAVLKTMALTEREQNGAKSNLIESPSIFGSFEIVDTPVINDTVTNTNTAA